MSIHPDEDIVLRFQAKHPGAKMHLRLVEMKFNYRDTFAGRSPEAYKTLLWDVIKNDATLFMRADQVEAAWRLLMPHSKFGRWRRLVTSLTMPPAHGGRRTHKDCWLRDTRGRYRPNW
jgi:glucose-6-phosphate 1-dehydrogenase